MVMRRRTRRRTRPGPPARTKMELRSLTQRRRVSDVEALSARHWLSGGMLLAPRTGGAFTTEDASPPNVAPWSVEQGAGVLNPPYGLPSSFERAVVRKRLDTSAFPLGSWNTAPIAVRDHHAERAALRTSPCRRPRD